jgi:hypothetical protein
LEAYKFVDALTTEEFKGAKAKSLEEVRKVINIQAIVSSQRSGLIGVKSEEGKIFCQEYWPIFHLEKLFSPSIISFYNFRLSLSINS